MSAVTQAPHGDRFVITINLTLIFRSDQQN